MINKNDPPVVNNPKPVVEDKLPIQKTPNQDEYFTYGNGTAEQHSPPKLMHFEEPEPEDVTLNLV